MPGLDAVFKLHDGYSKVVNKIIKKTGTMDSKVTKASSSVDKLDKIIAKVGSKSTGIVKVSSKITDVGNEANRTNNSLKGVNSTISKMGRNTSGLDNVLSKLKQYVALAALATGAVVGANITDNYINTQSRLSLMNDGSQTTEELQKKIMGSANNSRGYYGDMANSVAKLGILAGDSFSNNDEVIAFTELMQKSFKLSGSSSEEQSSAMYQLTQAMAAGKLQGDEFRSIMENAPMLAQAIATYTGNTKGELKEMSSEGLITADIIKGALFSAADEINNKFETMPITFSDIWNRIKNGAISAFGRIMEKVNKAINTEQFMALVEGITTTFHILASAVGFVIDTILFFAGVVSDMWGIIWPLLIGLSVAAIPIFLSMAGALWAMVYPVLANVAAWVMMNLPIILLVASIIWVIMALGEMGVTFEQVIGLLGGILSTFVTFFINIFIHLWNIVAAFINFLGNVFHSPIASIKKLFYDLMVSVLGFIEQMAIGIEKLINAIPGVEVNISGSITSLKDKLSSKAEDLKSSSDLKEFVKSKDFIDYGDAFNFGQDKGSKLGKSVSDKLSGLGDSLGGFKGFDPNKPLEVTNPDGGKGLNVNIDKDDIKYLQDLAEREYIAKYSTATLAPQVQVTFGDVRETADAGQVAKVIETILAEELAVVADGV